MTDVEEQRARQYAIHAVALRDGTVAGAASLFDTALTNGLICIVASDWPNKELRKNGATKSASELIELVSSKIRGDRWLIAKLEPFPFTPDDTSKRIEVDLDVLRQALNPAQRIRHGREMGIEKIPSVAVEALRKLDMHPALGVLVNAQVTEAEIVAATETAVEYERVAGYIELVGEDEIADRATRAMNALPADPKERSIGFGLGYCPMCGHESLVVSQIFDYGSEAGTCFACSHVVTEAAVAESEFRAMLESHEHE